MNKRPWLSDVLHALLVLWLKLSTTQCKLEQWYWKNTIVYFNIRHLNKKPQTMALRSMLIWTIDGNQIGLVNVSL